MCSSTTFSKYRSNVSGHRRANPPTGRKVTVQLPIYNERYVVERLVEAVAQFDYPRELARDSGAGRFHRRNQHVARDWWSATKRSACPSSTSTATIAKASKPARCRKVLKTATGEFVAIFDADFIPPADFLRRTVPYFTDPKLAMVQTRWSYINRNYSALTEVGSDPARRPLCHRAFVALPQRSVLQFQRHRGHLAPHRH